MKKINSQNIRFYVQAFFLALTLWIGVEFYLFVDFYIKGGTGVMVSRPPGVEGFLPISAMMSLYYWIISGNISYVHPAGLFIFLGIIFVSLVFKKAFCSWICPIGLISESLADIGKRIFKKNIVLNRYVDIPLRGIKYLLLGFFTYAVFSMSEYMLGIFLNSPYNKIADIKMLFFFTKMSAFTFWVLTVLILASIIIRGFWCRYLCPYGALLGILGVFSPFKIRREKETCTNCMACTKICPASIKVHEKKSIFSDECMSCYACVDVCPVKETLKYSLPKNKFHISVKNLAITVIILYFTVIGYAVLSGNWKNNITSEEYFYHINNMKNTTYTHPGMN